MARYEYESHTPNQSQQDLVRAVDLIARYANDHPGARIGCHIVLDLPEPQPDYDPQTPAA